MSEVNNTPNENIENDIEITQPTEPSPNLPKRAIWVNVLDYVELFAITLSVVFILFSFMFRTCLVDGDSMNNTLINEERVVISDFLYTPKRGDIIVFHQTGNKSYDRNHPLVKRVIGVGGDTVTIDAKTWTVTVTDSSGATHTLDEPYVYIDESRNHVYLSKTYNNGIHTFVVPEGKLFVLGDNRNNSLDSTAQSVIGFVDERRVLGKVVFRFAPISKFGAVD